MIESGIGGWSVCNPSRQPTRRLMCMLVAAIAVSAVPAWSQVLGPPITGTIQPGPSKKKFYEGVGAALVGTERVVHAVTGRGDDNGVLRGLREGMTVAVKEAAADVNGRATPTADAATTTEGLVTRIDARRRQIIVRFERGKTQKLQLVDRTAGDASPAPVVVTYPDDSGGKVSLDFTKVS